MVIERRCPKHKRVIHVLVAGIAVVLLTHMRIHADTAYVVLPYISHTDPRTLNDYENLFYTSYEKQVEQMVLGNKFSWRKVGIDYQKRISRAFRQILIRGEEHEKPVPTLPASAVDLCYTDSIDVLYVFYMYNDDDHVWSITNGDFNDPREEELYYYVSAYDVKKNVELYAFRKDVDDLLEFKTEKTGTEAVKSFISIVSAHLTQGMAQLNYYEKEEKGDRVFGKVMLGVGIATALTFFLLINFALDDKSTSGPQ